MREDREMFATDVALLEGPATRVHPALEPLLFVERHSGHRRGWLVKRFLCAADITALVLACLFAEFCVGGGPHTVLRDLGIYSLSLPFWIFGASLYGLYDRDEARPDHSTLDDIGGIFHLISLGTAGLVAGAVLADFSRPGLTKIFGFWAAAILLMLLLRVVARAVAIRQPAYQENTVIVGSDSAGRLVARKLLQHPEYGLNLIGFVGDPLPDDTAPALRHLPLLAPLDELEFVLDSCDVDRVIVALAEHSNEGTLDLVRSLSRHDVHINVVPRLYELISSRVDIHSVEGLPLICVPRLQLARTSKLLKRTLDIAISGFGLVLLAVPFGAIAFLIKLESSGPIFFRQVRRGAHERTFDLIKFRTMSENADSRKGEFAHLNLHTQNSNADPMFKVAGDPRVTRVGRVLRRYFLDELPQLINVLRGEMSLVGPRPLILEEDEHVRDWARRRLDLKPGMTGLWQVLGRNAISFDEMLRLDCLYVTTWTLGTDVRLLARTIPVALKGGGGSF